MPCITIEKKKFRPPPLEYTPEMDFVTKKCYNLPSDGVGHHPPFSYAPLVNN